MAAASSSSAQRCAWSRRSQNLKSMETLTDGEFDEEHEQRNEPCSRVQCECKANMGRWQTV
eukprot:243626-Lingulodinium_polyedra.AAC.1